MAKQDIENELTELLRGALDAEDVFELNRLERHSNAFRSCPLCDGGTGESLGLLGNRHHFRCKACGMDFSKQVRH